MISKMLLSITRISIVLFVLTLHTSDYPNAANAVAIEASLDSHLKFELVGESNKISFSEIVTNGNYAYIDPIADIGGVSVVDVSSPSAVSVIGTLYNIYAIELAVAGNYAYILDPSVGLQIMEISSNQAVLSKIGSYDLEETIWDGDMAIASNYAYIVNFDIYNTTSILHVIDISNPVSPFEAGSYNYLEGADSVYVDGNYAYVGGNGVFRVIDVSDPTFLSVVGFVNVPYSDHTTDVVVNKGYAYFTDDLGLHVIDVSNPVSPVEVGFYDTSSCLIEKLVVVGYYAYIANGCGLKIMDISSPHHLSEVGFYDGIYPIAIAVSGTYVYLSDDTRMVILHVIPPTYLPLIRNNYSIYFQGQWEREDNDDSSHANGALRFGQSYYGYHDDSNDYFGIYLPTGGRITADLTSQQDIKDGNGYYVTQLLLLDSNGRRLTYDDGPAAHLSYTASAGGWYYVRVFTNPDYLDSTKQYALQVSYP